MSGVDWFRFFFVAGKRKHGARDVVLCVRWERANGIDGLIEEFTHNPILAGMLGEIQIGNFA
jgi:hypothetical protein